MKDKLVIIGANEFQNQLILKAKERNIETHVFAWQDGSIGESTADYFYPISIVEKEQILAKAKEINPSGIISIASDLAVITVNYVAKELNLFGNSLESTVVSTNKFEMRKAFEKNNVPSPKFICVDKDTDLSKLNVEYPVIIKPTDRSGSRGINKIFSFDEMQGAVDAAIDVSFSKKALIEEFAEGREFSIEYISQNGKHNFLAVTEKFTTGAPHFIETGHMQPARITKEQEDHIKEIIPRALDALGIKNSASHSELKIDSNGNIKIIEIGARMGGDCIGSDLVKISTGYDFVSMVIDVAMGKKLEMKKVCEPKVALVKFIFSMDDYKLLQKIKDNNPDKIYRISDVEDIGSRQVTDSSTRFGYFILQCDSQEEGLSLLGMSGKQYEKCKK
ncbi:MAG: ATP-grasp domain-containing protein [Clostridium sp.]|nr:ATP-grasp domain-containing protein [Clostridium sp.]